MADILCHTFNLSISENSLLLAAKNFSSNIQGILQNLNEYKTLKLSLPSKTSGKFMRMVCNPSTILIQFISDHSPFQVIPPLPYQ
jgi:hypothetical protein